MSSSFYRRKFTKASGYNLNCLLGCGKQVSVEEWCEVLEKKFFRCLSNCIESCVLFCFPSDLCSYMVYLNMFLKFSSSFSQLFLSGLWLSFGHFLVLLSQHHTSTIALRNCETPKHFRLQCCSCFASQSCSSEVFAPLSWEQCWEACFAVRLLGCPLCASQARSSETCCCGFSLYALVPPDIPSLPGRWTFVLTFEEGQWILDTIYIPLNCFLTIQNEERV